MFNEKEENNFKPQIITEAIHLELDSLDMEKVYELKEPDLWSRSSCHQHD